MASSFSTDLKLELMVTGENAGTWGTKTNTNLNLLQQAIAGYQSISIAGGAQTTALTMDNAAISNARNAVIELTGTITGNQVVTIPNGIEKTYIIFNNTVGAFTVQFKTASGTGYTFATTDKTTRIFYSNGTNIIDSLLVNTAGIDTLTNKTLTSPKIGTSILDTNGNELALLTATASAVNELTITNAATGNAPSIATSGSDTNISLTIAPKGTGDVNVDADTLRVGDSNADATITTNGTGDLTLSTNTGSNSGTIKIFDGVNGNIEVTPNGSGVVKLDGLSYPTADGSANQALVTNGSGVLSFAAVGAAAGQVIQVVTATDSTQRTTSSTTFVTASNTLSVSITPSSASNKIFVIATTTFGVSGDGNMYGTIFRGATNIGDATNGMAGASASIACTAGMSVLDSPNTTSATTYEVRVRVTGGTSSMNWTGTKGSITCLEIKG